MNSRYVPFEYSKDYVSLITRNLTPPPFPSGRRTSDGILIQGCRSITLRRLKTERPRNQLLFKVQLETERETASRPVSPGDRERDSQSDTLIANQTMKKTKRRTGRQTKRRADRQTV